MSANGTASWRPRRSLDGLVANSPAMRAVVEQARALAAATTPIWIEGQSGVGKTTLARAIHHASPRATGPLIELALATIPHAEQRTRCLEALDAARGGTVVFPYFESATDDVRTRVSRWLLEGPLAADANARARLIFTSTRCVPRELCACAAIRVPPLRERAEDLPALIDLAWSDAPRPLGRHDAVLTDEARRSLCEHDWPGNVRELWNTVLRGLFLAKGPTVGPRELFS